jgi:hypothetical protein
MLCLIGLLSILTGLDVFTKWDQSANREVPMNDLFRISLYPFKKLGGIKRKRNIFSN